TVLFGSTSVKSGMIHDGEPYRGRGQIQLRPAHGRQAEGLRRVPVEHAILTWKIRSPGRTQGGLDREIAAVQRCRASKPTIFYRKSHRDIGGPVSRSCRVGTRSKKQGLRLYNQEELLVETLDHGDLRPRE